MIQVAKVIWRLSISRRRPLGTDALSHAGNKSNFSRSLVGQDGILPSFSGHAIEEQELLKQEDMVLAQSSKSINYKFPRVRELAVVGRRLQMVCQYVSKKSRSAHAEIALKTPEHHKHASASCLEQCSRVRISKKEM
jgi:hypothetical protein